MSHPWSLSFRYFMGILLIAALIGLFFYAHRALEPVMIAAFTAYVINPAVVLLTQKTRLKRRTAVNLVYFTTLALMIAIPATFTPLFFDELKGVATDLFTIYQQAQSLFSKPLILANGLSLDFTHLGMGLDNLQSTFVSPLPGAAFLLLENTSRGVLWSLVVIVLVYLFLSEWHEIRDGLISLAPAPYRQEVQDLYLRVRGVWMAYLRGQLLLMLIVGVVFTLAWSILGIPGALVLGIIAGLFTLVPDVGPFIAATLALGVTLLEGSSWIPLSNLWVTVIAFAVYLVLINLKGLWIRPIIMGRMVNMNEGLVFVSILVATVLSGILGALLVVPLLASGLIIVKYLLRRISGQPPFEQASTLAVSRAPKLPNKKINRN